MNSGDSDGRERKFFLEQIRPKIEENENNSREKTISLWVHAKRAEHHGLTPGRIVDTALKFFFFIFTISSFSAGIGMTVSYLAYSGAKPVNIAVYIAFFIFLPILLQGLSLISLLSFRLKCLPGFFQIPYTLVSYILRKAALRLTSKISGKKRIELDATLGTIRVSRDKYSGLYFQTFFKLFQITGLMFSIGVLMATLFKVITTDLAFGWQTTIQTAPETIHTIVSMISSPWAWAVPDHLSAPSIPQVEGSRIILKDGIENLLSADMASWWPFLCFAVFFYTILPRIVLSVTGQHLENREIRKCLNTSHTADRIVSMLTSAYMTSGCDDTIQSSINNKVGCSGQSSGISPINAHSTALIPEDIYETGNIKAMFKETSSLKISGDIIDDLALLTKTVADSQGSLILICEAWMPPINETLDYLKKLRELSDKNTGIIVGLLGKPLSGAKFMKVSEEDFMVWQNKIKALGDDGISLIRY